MPISDQFTTFFLLNDPLSVFVFFFELLITTERKAGNGFLENVALNDESPTVSSSSRVES